MTYYSVAWSTHHERADQNETVINGDHYRTWAEGQGYSVTDVTKAHADDVWAYVTNYNHKLTTGTGELIMVSQANLEVDKLETSTEEIMELLHPNPWAEADRASEQLLLDTEARYWTTKFPHAVDALVELTQKSASEVAEELALIAGDRATMPHDEVMGTFRGDNNLPELPQEFEDKRQSLAMFLLAMATGLTWDDAEGVDDFHENYTKDADEILRAHPHLLGLGTREEMGIE